MGCVVVLAGCSQVVDYTYSKRNFTSSTFEADLSTCKRQSPPISAFQNPPLEKRAQLDDAAVRDCMVTKGTRSKRKGDKTQNCAFQSGRFGLSNSRRRIMYTVVVGGEFAGVY